MTVWKYPFEIEDIFTLEMSENAEVLYVSDQDGQPTLWALVDPDMPSAFRSFAVVATGQPAPPKDQGRHVGTFQQLGGALVWHIFEEIVS